MALFVLLVSIFLGFIFSTEIPEGTVFATVIPAVNGQLPQTIFGSLVKPLVIPVPDELTPAPRPGNEMFLELPSGAQMPASGLGLCCRASAYDFESVRRTVLWYLLKGGRLLDTAQLYLNHKAVGAGIKDAIARGIPREEIFITTKLTPRFYSGTGPADYIPKFLEELGVEYLDLVLLHHPEGIPVIGTCPEGTAPECRANAWKFLSDLQDQGLVRDVGVSNFQINQIDALRAMKRSPVAVNQIQYNPWAPDWQQEVVNYCQDNGITITAWGSFQGTMMQHSSMFTVETLKEIAKAKGVSVPQIMLRWALQKGAAVIPGTGNPRHMDSNLDVFSFELSASEIAILDDIRNDPKAKDFAAMGFEKNES